ncbi:MAG: peptide ABC transporter substrate-binding protein [Candidatus Eremiobacteraeota bacterium]|nr:peptide ABC transporter substrate-binding protein [Candidatus Eremiobacteraeota bacterium]
MLLLAALALAGCGRVNTSGGGNGGGGRVNATTQPHVLRFSYAEDLETLNPALSIQGALAPLAEMTMAYLFRYGHDNRPVPELATEVPTKANGDISADGKTIRIKLRRGVKWSDGVPFSADDVMFSTNVMNNPANNVLGRDGFDLVQKMDEPDKYTVVFHLRRPFSTFLPIFFTTGGAEPPVLPKHLLGTLPNINNATYNSLPVGIGPFKYTAWNRGNDVELAANPLYWRGLPKLKRVIFKIIPDRNTVFTQLSTGELDLWYPATGQFYARIKALQGYDVIRQPSYYYDHFDFNVTRPALRDRAVRQALRLALDRRTILEKVRHGVGILQESFLPPTYPYIPKNIPLVPFDIAEANRVLDAAGWRRGPGGVRSKNGVRLNLEFASSVGTPDTDTQLELVRGWWKQIGVNFTVKRYLSSLLFNSAAEGGIIYGGKFDVVAYASGNEAVADLSVEYSCRSMPPNGQNVTHYCNRALQPLFADFRSTYGYEAQAPIQARLDRAIVDDVPSIVTDAREDLFGISKDVKNFHPNAVSPFDDMMKVDI